MRALALLLICGCSSDVELILPDRPTAQSMILAFVRDGEVTAHALRDGQAYLGELDLDREVSITAMLFDRTLAELGLAEGPLPEDEAGRPFPAFDEALATIVRRGGTDEWSPIAELAPELLAFRIASSTCRTIEQDWLRDAGSIGDVIFDLERIDSGSALMLTDSGGRTLYHRIDAAGASEIAVDVPSDFRPTVAARLSDGRFALAGAIDNDLVLLRGSLDRGFEIAARTPLRTTEDLLRELVEGESGELYGLTNQSELVRITDAFEILGGELRFGVGGALLWVADRELLYVPRDGNALFRWRDGSFTREATEIDALLDRDDQTVYSLYRHPRGTMAGAGFGRLLLEDATWRVIGVQTLEVRINVITEFDGGAIAGCGTLGVIQRVDPGEGLICNEVILGRSYHVKHLVEIEGGLLVAGDREPMMDVYLPFTAHVSLE